MSDDALAHDPSRMRVAIADPSSFGQNMLCDLLLDEGVKDIVKFSTGREVIAALMHESFDLVLVDDGLPHVSAVELVALAERGAKVVPKFMTLQSALDRTDLAFLREFGLSGVLLKPIAPKRFSAMFRSIFRAMPARRLAA